MIEKLEELEKKHQRLKDKVDKNFKNAECIAEESRRVADIALNMPRIMHDLDREFESITRLNEKDIAFLFIATALQIVRQYLLTSFPARLGDKEAAKNTIGHIDEHSCRKHRYYNPSLDEIIFNPVPFDAIRGSNGALKGGGSLGHRVTALGHDPLIGLIVGTCNIATSTMTNNRLESFHINTGIDNMDVFSKKANTALVFERSADKLINQGYEGKVIMGTSLVKEIVHLNSDLNTKNSLPLPVVSVVDGKLASRLAEYGLDMSNVTTVTKQASYSVMINTLIAMLHAMYAPEDIGSSLYEVRTKKILSYSNVIATSSNLIYVGANVAAGNESALSKLDIGGLLVTCYRVATDVHFIEKVKREFIEREFFKMINGC